MLVGMSDERTVFGELLVTQLADVSRPATDPMSSHRQNGGLNRRTAVVAGRLERPPALTAATPARCRVLRQLDRHRDGFGVAV